MVRIGVSLTAGILAGLLLGSGAALAGPKTLFESVFGGESTEGNREEEKRLDPDRPHLPEASTAVGNGRVVLETGYTFSEKGSVRSHSAPEALLRVGAFADWFELRLGQNFVSREHTVGDLYAGAKLALTEQQRYVPQIAVIPQMTVADVNRVKGGTRVFPGLNVDCGWEIVKDRFGVELLIATNRVRDDVRGSHVEVATGLTAAVNLRRDLEAFVEWDAFYPAGNSDAGSRARDYIVGGFVYFITKNVAVDIRAGVGLNRPADDVLAGLGLSVRY